MTWTRAQIQAEKNYIIEEHLGILCGDNDPTPEQLALARAQADDWEKTISSTDKQS